MKKHNNMKNIITAITGLLFSIILVCLITFGSSYTKAAPSIIQYNASAGVEYYVSGQYVEYDETNRKYVVTKDSPVTIAVINNNMISQVDNNVLLTVKGKNATYTSATQIITFNAVVDEEYSINVNTRAISKADHGRSLSDPYIIKSFNEFKVLYKVLRNLTLDGSESEIKSELFGTASALELSTSYFKLFDNIIVDMDEFYGLKDFKGVFDFNGYSLTLNVTNKNYIVANDGDDLVIDSNNTVKALYAGLFSKLSNSDSAPCVIRNGQVRGSISLTPNTPDEAGRIFIGGLAGKSSGNVFVDKVKTSVSLAADDNTSIYMGGFFGATSSPIDKHYGLTYNGVHTVLSATSNGKGAYTYVGGFAGTIDNTYVTGYKDESNYLTIISNSLNSVAGGAVAGGFTAAIDHQTGNLSEISIDNILFKTKGTLSISATSNNDNATNASSVGYAVAGGVFGVSYGTKPIKHGLVQFIDGTANKDKLLVEIYAANQSSTSHGNTFAGGLYGHVSGTNEFKYIPSEKVTIFDCDVVVKSIQNGYDAARAGGMFGFGAFSKSSDEKLTIDLTSKNGSIDVLAEQSSNSKSAGNSSVKEVSAGYYSSSLPLNYVISNLEMTINNGKLVAQRSVGSTIIGPVYAGGFAGSATSETDKVNQFKNIDINLNDADVAALGLSFDSNKGAVYTGEDSNLAAGGFIGFISYYGSASIDRGSNQAFASNSVPGVENVTVNIDLSKSRDYIIKGVQNAVGGGSDHRTEGYVGGVIGYTIRSYFRNIAINGDENFECLVNFNSTNSPNTAACGGLIGENHKSNDFALQYGYVNNIDVRLDAYYSGSSNSGTYDTFCGGIVGVVADTSNKTIVRDVYISNSSVSCIGENTMRAYAGGAFGGIWGDTDPRVYNCKVFNTEVYASSLGYDFYVGGIAGLCTASSTGSIFNRSPYEVFENCYVIDCTLSGYSSNQAGSIAGICPELGNNGIGTKNCFSNAYIYGETTGDLILSPILDNFNGGWNNAGNKYTNNYFVPLNIQKVTEGMAVNNIPKINDTTNNKHLAIGASSGLQSSISLSTNQSATLYPNASTSSGFSIKYSGDNCYTSNGFTITATANSGTVYANLYLTVPEYYADGSSVSKEYLFASYPVYINGGNQNSSFAVYDVSNSEDGSIISASSGNNYYIPVQVGAIDKQEIKIVFDESSPKVTLYKPTLSNNINTLISGLGNSVAVNVFNEKVSVNMTDKYILLTADEDILTRTIIGIKINNSYVFVDYTPNYVDYIKIYTSDDTPSLGTTIIDSKEYHIFAPGDTVVMEGIEVDVNGRETVSDVISYTISTTAAATTVTGYSNGRIDIASDGVSNGTTIVVTGKYDGALGDGSVDTVEYNIVVLNNITVTTNIVGGSYSASRKAINSQDYKFTVNPNPGFGLSPDLVEIIIGTNNYDLTDQIESNIGERPTTSLSDVSIKLNDVDFIVSYSHDTGGYTITIPGSIMNGNVTINFKYSLTADIIFDFGYAYSKKGNERYYIYTVKTGTKLDSTIYDSIKNNINVSLYGYQRQDYHFTDTATSVESFGSSLEQIVADGTKVINGPLYFYARWTNEAIIEYPDGISVESTLPIGLLEETVGGEIKLIPITTSTAFTFKIIPDSSYKGTPSFFVYIYNEYGEFIDITDHCTRNELGGYEIDPYYIDGIIYIKVFNQNIVFNDGESESEESVDVEIYGDSIFTINYSINYAKEGVSKESAVLGNDMSLQFNKALPSGTSIRLYRSYNSSAQDTYVYKLNSESDIINLSSFINMYDGKTLANSEIIGTSIFNETYYFVVTLPNNKQVNNFLNDNYVQFNVSFVDNDNINVTEYLSEGNKGNITARPNYINSGLGKVYFHIYQTVGINVTESNNKLTVTVGSEVVVDGVVVEDLRHEDKYYVWEVYNPNGINVNATNNVFGSNNFITDTLSASYYLANGTTNDISSLSGCIIRLLEVTNTLSPASGVVLYTKNL